MCALVADDSPLKLNSNGCESGMSCYMIDVLVAGNISFSTNLTYPNVTCRESLPFNLTDSVPFTSFDCGLKLPNKNFKNGHAVVSCSSDSDCELEDGIYTQCFCVFKTDGTGVCLPDIRSSVSFGLTVEPATSSLREPLRITGSHT